MPFHARLNIFRVCDDLRQSGRIGCHNLTIAVRVVVDIENILTAKINEDWNIGLLNGF